MDSSKGIPSGTRSNGSRPSACSSRSSGKASKWSGCRGRTSTAWPGHVAVRASHAGGDAKRFRDHYGAVRFRYAVFSENTFAFRDAVRPPLGRPVDKCWMTMVHTARCKYVHFDGLRPQLFNPWDDTHELVDLGDDPAHTEVRARLVSRSSSECVDSSACRPSSTTTSSTPTAKSLRWAFASAFGDVPASQSPQR